MTTLNNTNIFLLIAVIAMIILILYSPESYKNKNEPLIDDKKNEKIDMDNKKYNLGDYYFSEMTPEYNVYNAYKSDPSIQPITLPSVDYNNEFQSTLSKNCNPMYAIPEPGSTYINLLNASKNY
jgi:hypothetical protein